MNVILYKSAICPKCKVIATKLDQKGIPYTIVDNVQTILEKGITTIPTLDVDGIRYTDVCACNNWIKSQGGNK